jgi:hypothetical protein
MFTMKTYGFIGALLTVLALIISPLCLASQTTAFSYQGQLSATGSGLVNAANVTITFALYDSETNGNLVILPTGINPVSTSGGIVDGLFTRTVDFGQVFKSSTQYWIEVAVVDDSGTHILSPRQIIDAVPVAQYALSSSSISGISAGGDLNGTYPSPVVASHAVTLAKQAGSDHTTTLGGSNVAAQACFYGAVPASGAQVGDQVVMTFPSTQPPTGMIVYAAGVKTANQVVVVNCNVTKSSLSMPNITVRVTTWR